MAEKDRFVAEEALRLLKPFQRRTVDYVTKRLYEDPDFTRRFLVADEVGLGKTMVARGVIARTVERLWRDVKRIDVIYICSNRAIASQNINRLNVLSDQAVSLPTRMTLLPLRASALSSKKVNFVSLTPGTSFSLKSTTGVLEERALLVHMLKDTVGSCDGLKNLLQVGVKDENWDAWVESVGGQPVESTLKDDYCRRVNDDADLFAELTCLCREFYCHYREEEYPWDLRCRRNATIGRLRAVLARTCVDALEPDLIVLDEFQRFTELLRGDSDASILAKDLFDYRDPDGNEARTLLLSATPYRMLSLATDSEDGNHYREFLETVEFLYGEQDGPEVAQRLGRELDQFRQAMLCLPNSYHSASEVRSGIEARLRSVIARTERTARTEERDALVRERPLPATVEVEDLLQFAEVSGIAEAAGEHAPVDYWKSAPYLLNFMHDYALKRALKDEGRARRPNLVKEVSEARRCRLSRRRVAAFRALDPANGRMRELLKDMLGENLHQHLWIPPSLLYYSVDGVGQSRLTKALVFATWTMVPDSIAAIVSYEAERKMGVQNVQPTYFNSKGPRLLNFKVVDDRPAQLRLLNLLYPSPLLAEIADPLAVCASRSDSLEYDQMRSALRDVLRPVLSQLSCGADRAAHPETWHWASCAVSDALANNRATEWLNGADVFAWPRTEHDESDKPRTHGKGGFQKHIEALRDVARSKRVAGEPADEALDLLVDLALGSPAICALRCLRRVVPELGWDDPTMLTAATHVAWGFRTLFNHPDAVALLRTEDHDRYWHSVLTYGARHNLQAVLDEYAHCLVEALGLTSKCPRHRANELAVAMHDVLSLRPSQIDVDDPRIVRGKLKMQQYRMRGRFAMRFGNYRDDEGGEKRPGALRDAFNSPFRPFVLATTSIGQEGLDFHPYCRRVYHWNLPSNPVDLEQREGRVNRYKCHAVRLNVAAKFAEQVRGRGVAPVDPWAAMFSAASKATAASDASGTADGLVPFWIYDGDARVERCVPMLPFSREIELLEGLKKSVAAYRLAFGQPRQDDLLAYLTKLTDTLPQAELDALQIRLDPPASGDRNDVPDADSTP